jgi:hypothetical protein
MNIANSRQFEAETNDIRQNYAGRAAMTSVAVHEMTNAIQPDKTLPNRVHDARRKKNGGLAPAV